MVKRGLMFKRVRKRLAGVPDPPGEWCNCGLCIARRKSEGKRAVLKHGGPVYSYWDDVRRRGFGWDGSFQGFKR